MSVTVFLILLAGFAAITSISTEGVKKLLDGQSVNYSSNIIVLIISIIIGCGGTAIYYLNNDISFTVLNVIYLVLMGLANWLTAMLGYDKVKQAIEQLVSKDE